MLDLITFPPGTWKGRLTPELFIPCMLLWRWRMSYWWVNCCKIWNWEMVTWWSRLDFALIRATGCLPCTSWSYPAWELAHVSLIWRQQHPHLLLGRWHGQRSSYHLHPNKSWLALSTSGQGYCWKDGVWGSGNPQHITQCGTRCAGLLHSYGENLTWRGFLVGFSRPLKSSTPKSLSIALYQKGVDTHI